ncbi:hypothetical protein pb186bvf_008010, partial [Paramecium bursaria]
LFNIYLDEFLKEFKDECPISYQQLMFADDLAFLVKSKDANILLKYLERLSVEWELKINKSKSGVMPLHKKKKVNREGLRGFPVVKQYKYLGITINNMGSIDPHIDNIKGILNMIAKGATLTKMILVWSLIIKPHFLYLACALNIQKFKKYYRQVELLYKGTFKKAVGISKSVSDDVLKDLMPDFGEMIVDRSQKVTQQVQNRGLEMTRKPFKHKDLNLPKEKRIKLKDRNVPRNIHMILNKQWNICEQHNQRMTPDHILNYHIGIDGTKVVEGFKEKKNIKQIKQIEKRISEFQTDYKEKENQ